MTIEIIEGDLLNSGEFVIAHGCNCRGVMGAGVAGQIARRWPHVLEENRRMVRHLNFYPGVVQPASTAFAWSHPSRGEPLTVMNMATQEDPGPNAKYDYVDLAFRNLAELCVVTNIDRVAIPQIGCGIGGLQWKIVEDVIEEAIGYTHNRHKLEIVCYVYTP